MAPQGFGGNIVHPSITADSWRLLNLLVSWFVGEFPISLYLKLVQKRKVRAQDFAYYLKELADICVLCNDSSLSYNEVSVSLTIVLTCT